MGLDKDRRLIVAISLSLSLSDCFTRRGNQPRGKEAENSRYSLSLSSLYYQLISYQSTSPFCCLLSPAIANERGELSQGAGDSLDPEERENTNTSFTYISCWSRHDLSEKQELRKPAGTCLQLKTDKNCD